MNDYKLCLNFYTDVRNTKLTELNSDKAPKTNPTLDFELNKNANVELRISGDPNTLGVAFVHTDAGGNRRYGNVFDHTGQFLPGIADVYRILSFQTVDLSSGSTAVSHLGAWQVSGNFSSVAGANDYIIIPRTCNYGAIISYSKTGTTINAKAINLSGETHTCTMSFLVLAVRNVG